MSADIDIAGVKEQVLSSAKYKNVFPPLVEKIIFDEIKKVRNEKDLVKAVKNKLHQTGTAFIHSYPNYQDLEKQVRLLPKNINSPELQQFCWQTMDNHVSTRERLSILPEFFNKILSAIAPVDSILDLACGLNPLSIPWMPVSKNILYYGCDIFSDQIDFLKNYYDHLSIPGEFFQCDLTEKTPAVEVQVAYLLKTIPCLEQINKTIGPKLLDKINARHLVVSFPAHSIGGRSKGMARNYEEHFLTIADPSQWEIEKMMFPGELVFLLSRK